MPLLFQRFIVFLVAKYTKVIQTHQISTISQSRYDAAHAYTQHVDYNRMRHTRAHILQTWHQTNASTAAASSQCVCSAFIWCVCVWSLVCLCYMDCHLAVTSCMYNSISVCTELVYYCYCSSCRHSFCIWCGCASYFTFICYIPSVQLPFSPPDEAIVPPSQPLHSPPPHFVLLELRFQYGAEFCFKSKKILLAAFFVIQQEQFETLSRFHQHLRYSQITWKLGWMISIIWFRKETLFFHLFAIKERELIMENCHLNREFLTQRFFFGVANS